jgi:hypothetical protein
VHGGGVISGLGYKQAWENSAPHRLPRYKNSELAKMTISPPHLLSLKTENYFKSKEAVRNCSYAHSTL